MPKKNQSQNQYKEFLPWQLFLLLTSFPLNEAEKQHDNYLDFAALTNNPMFKHKAIVPVYKQIKHFKSKLCFFLFYLQYEHIPWHIPVPLVYNLQV